MHLVLMTVISGITVGFDDGDSVLIDDSIMEIPLVLMRIDDGKSLIDIVMGAVLGFGGFTIRTNDGYTTVTDR